MKIKTSELTGPALDWAVAKCDGVYFENLREFEDYALNYCTDWEHGGPIIEREGLGVTQYNNIPNRPENRWQCVKYYGGMRLGNYRPLMAYGPTPLIAAMRCYVASKLGDEVEIPEELK
jgi:hypothetical protein